MTGPQAYPLPNVGSHFHTCGIVILQTIIPTSSEVGTELTAAALWSYLAGIIMLLLHEDILKNLFCPCYLLISLL